MRFRIRDPIRSPDPIGMAPAPLQLSGLRVEGGSPRLPAHASPRQRRCATPPPPLLAAVAAAVAAELPRFQPGSRESAVAPRARSAQPRLRPVGGKPSPSAAVSLL